MTRTFCDQCGEIIADGKYVTGAYVHLDGPKGRETTIWTIEVKIKSMAREWKLCPDCGHEIMERAFKEIAEKALKLKETL